MTLKKTCVESVADGFPSVFGCKRAFQVWIKSVAPNVTGTHYVSTRQVFAVKTLKQIMSLNTQAVNFLNTVL
jgi:hypothetical protein